MRPGERELADELEAALEPAERELLDELADGIARRRLTTPAIFFVETMKPLNLVGASALVFLRPILSLVWNDSTRYDRVVKLLEHRGAMEVLLRRLEARA